MTTADKDIDLSALLTRLDACREAREWAAGKTPEQAWNECPRGDWMLWLAGMLDIDRKVLVRATCACARLALPHVPAGERRPLKSIKTVERWTQGKATIKDVQAAAAATWAAADAAWAAARAAADAAWAACASAEAAAAWAASAAASAASGAAWAAADAEGAAADAEGAAAGAWGAAWASKLAECADLVRRHIPFAKIAEKAKKL